MRVCPKKGHGHPWRTQRESHVDDTPGNVRPSDDTLSPASESKSAIRSERERERAREREWRGRERKTRALVRAPWREINFGRVEPPSGWPTTTGWLRRGAPRFSGRPRRIVARRHHRRSSPGPDRGLRRRFKNTTRQISAGGDGATYPATIEYARCLCFCPPGPGRGGPWARGGKSCVGRDPLSRDTSPPRRERNGERDGRFPPPSPLPPEAFSSTVHRQFDTFAVFDAPNRRASWLRFRAPRLLRSICFAHVTR